MIRTYIDAGVLIAAAREVGEASARALAILDDPQREFASSVFVRLEILPKAIFNKRDRRLRVRSRSKSPLRRN